MPPKKKRPADGPPPNTTDPGGPSGPFLSPTVPVFNPGNPLFVPPAPPMFVSIDQHLQLAKMLENATNTIQSLVLRVTELEKALATKTAAPTPIVVTAPPTATTPSWSTVAKRNLPTKATPPASTPSKAAAPSLTLRERTIIIKPTASLDSWAKDKGQPYDKLVNPGMFDSIRAMIHKYTPKPIIQTVSFSRRKNVILTTLPNVSAKSVFTIVDKAVQNLPRLRGTVTLSNLTWQAEIRAVPTNTDLQKFETDFKISNPHLKLDRPLRWLVPDPTYRANRQHTSVIAEIVRPDLTSLPPTSIAALAVRYRVRLLAKKAPLPKTPGGGSRGKGKGVDRMEEDVRK